MKPATVNPFASSKGDLAGRFFLVAGGVFAVGALIAWGLIAGLGRSGPPEGLRIPAAFGLSTAILAAGSVLLQRAISNVRHERQLRFRGCLLGALVLGGVFFGIQAFAMSRILPEPSTEAAVTGVAAYIFVAAFLHAMHFTVAVLFLVFVTLRSFQDRYDHEYYRGVSACAWLWHLLGALWLCILFTLFISAH